MLSKEKIKNFILNQINNLIVNKIDFKSKKVLKTLKFKNKKENINENFEIIIGNEGKVFSDIIIAKKNSSKDKFVILYSSKHEEPYTLLINSNANEELEKLIESLNKKEINNLKNKSMELNYIYNFLIKEVLS